MVTSTGWRARSLRVDCTRHAIIVIRGGKATYCDDMSTNSGSIRTRWAAIGAAVAVTIGAAGIGGYNLVNAEISSGDRPVFVPINPCRLTDTRTAPNTVGSRTTPLGVNETIAVTAHGENGKCTGASKIPTDAIALALNVTALGATSQTFLTFWGTGDNPGTANLNPAPGQPPTPNAVNTPLSTTGTFNVYNERGTVNVVIDVNGYYANHNHDDRYANSSKTVQVIPSEFVPRNETTDFARSGVLWLVNGSECFQAPLHLPNGATIKSVTGMVSIENANDSVDVRLSRTLFAAGTSSIGAQPGYIANVKQQVTSTNQIVHVSAPVVGDTIANNGVDTVVDNTTFFYYAEVCVTAGHRIYGYTVELA